MYASSTFSSFSRAVATECITICEESIFRRDSNFFRIPTTMLSMLGICMYVCTCMYAYIHANCMFICMYVCMFAYTHVYICMLVSIYECMYISIYICMHLYSYVCMYVCMYANSRRTCLQGFE